MKAYAIDRFGDVDEIRARDLPEPDLAEDQLLIRVHGAALNPADSKVLSGRGGGRFLRASKFPLVLGFDFSGVVERVGASVRGRSVGDEVFGFLPYSRKNRQGSFAELLAVPADEVALKPAEMSHIEAACSATVASTALQGLRDKGGLSSGQRVLINGASGGVGLYAVQIAKHLGAEVWATCSAAKAERVREMGADQIVDYRETPIGRLHERAEARFQIVFDAASRSSLAECRHLLERGGAYVTLLPSPSLLTGLLRGLLTRRACRLVIVKSRHDDLAYLADATAEGWLRHTVDAVYPIDELPEAIRRQSSGEVVGKIGVDMTGFGEFG